jgi:hypothetical protein
VPAAPAGAHQRTRAVQAMGGGQLPDSLVAFWPVDVQDIEGVAGGQADVGLGVAGPPSADPGPVAGGVLDPVGDQGAQGMLASLAAARIPTRAADPWRRRRLAADRLEVVSVGEGVVQGQDQDAPGGIAHGGVAQLPAGPAHRTSSAVEGRWRCRNAAALLRPQPAASARVRAVQACPSGRGCA